MKKLVCCIVLAVGLAGCSNSAFDIWRADVLSGLSKKSAENAVRLYRKALSDEPEGQRLDSIRLKLAKTYLARGDYSQAIEVLRNIESKEGRVFLGKALLKNADYTEALDIFNKVGEEGDDEYIYDYALAAEKSNLYDQALRLYEKIEKNPLLREKAVARVKEINLASHNTLFAGVSPEVVERIKSAPDQKEYPDASGVYLLIDEKIKLTEDNREISEMHYVLKILNDRGKEKFAEVSLGYDSTYEKLELEYARTIKPDGTVVTVGDKNIRDVSVYLNFPLYSNARMRIISMPEVAPGSVIEYKARLTRSKLPNEKDFDTTYWLQTDEPILLERCAISVPKTRDLKYKIVNGKYNTFGFDMEPKLRLEGDEKIYRMEFSGVPQIVPEPGMPSLARVNPYLLFSTFSGWDDIYSWWRELYKDKIAADEDIKKKVRELTDGKTSRYEKIRAIYNYCVQEVRYVAVEYGDAGYEPHYAKEIFKNKYGDCKDKAILLISMLEAAGIEAYPVLISTFDSLDMQEDLPSLMFNHAIAAVEADGKIVFMDATGTTVSFGDLPVDDQDRETLVFFPDKQELIRTPLFPPGHNSVVTKMSIKINKDEGIEAKRQVDTTGVYMQAQRFWLKFTMPVLIEEQLKQRARTFASGATLLNYDIKNVDDLNSPVILSFTFNAPQFLKKAGTTRIMDQLGGIDASWVAKESRKYPIEVSIISVNEEFIEIELPEHLAVKYLPRPVSIETRWFDFINRYEMTAKNKLRFYSLSKIKERLVAAEDYPKYKKALEETAVLSQQQLIIEEKK